MKTLTVLIWILPIFASRRITTACFLPKCSCTGFEMNCREGNFSEIPNNLTARIRKLHFSNNKVAILSSIENSALQLLDLSKNEIKVIEYDAFSRVNHLQELILSENNIQILTVDTFERNLKKLEVLLLDGNQLSYIQNFLFHNLENLKVLHLQNNMISSVHRNAFYNLQNLKSLRLDGNRLHTIDYKWFNNLASLKSIQLHANPWSCDCEMQTSYQWLGDIENANWFSKMTEKHPVYCASPKKNGGKKLVETRTYKARQCDMPRIRPTSQIISVNDGAQLRLHCFVHGNRYPIPRIAWTAPNNDIYRQQTSEMYEGVSVTSDGTLEINGVSHMDEGRYICTASNSKGAVKVSIHVQINAKQKATRVRRPHINSIAGKSFFNVRVKQTCPDGCLCVLKSVQCPGFRFKRERVPEEISSDILKIDLAYNNLKRIRISDFEDFHLLEELDLSYNEIERIESKAFHNLPALTTLSLRGNRISKIKEGTFSYLFSLIHLDLEGNHLTTLSSGVFEGLMNLKWLNIKGNKISTITRDTFRSLWNIKSIHLEKNYLRAFPFDAIYPLLQFTIPERRIFLEGNPIECSCGLVETRAQITSTDSQESIIGNDLRCTQPDEFRGVRLVDLEMHCSNDFLPQRKSLLVDT